MTILNHNVLGGILIVAGTTIGGGMLALPIASACVGFWISSLLMLMMWGFMTYTALITLEMNLYFHKGISMSYAAEYSFGKIGKLISTGSILLLFYALLSAYMVGGASILHQILQRMGMRLSSTVMILLFSTVFGSIVLARTRKIDLLNRFFLLIKMVCFLGILILILPKTDPHLLNYTPMHIYHEFSLLIPLFFTSFGFHGSIPTIVNYIGPDRKKLNLTFMVGSGIPLIIYIIWNALALGVIPLDGPNSFQFIRALGQDVGTFTKILSLHTGGNAIVILCEGFTFLAIVTSFLGVGLGLFDFMEEQLTWNEKVPSVGLTAIFTFIIPLIFALFYPKGFIIALRYASIALSFLAVIIPTLVVLKLRHVRQRHLSGYQRVLKNIGVFTALIFGIFVIILEFFSFV